MYNVLFIAFIAATAASLPPHYYMYKAGADRYAYTDGKVCRLFEKDQTIYLQIEDAYALEHSQPVEIGRSPTSCPYRRELCFRSSNQSFVLLREQCSNRSRLIKGPFDEIHFLLNYDLIRYDTYMEELYVLIQPELYVCRLDQFLRVLDSRREELPVDLNCHRQIHITSTKWQDFQVSNGLLIYMVDRQIYELGEHQRPLMSSSTSDSIPFVIFPTANNNPTSGFLLVSWWHTLWYALEITILLLLVYLCRVQVRRTTSGSIFISPPPPSDGPYRETVSSPLIKV